MNLFMNFLIYLSMNKALKIKAKDLALALVTFWNFKNNTSTASESVGVNYKRFVFFSLIFFIS